MTYYDSAKIKEIIESRKPDVVSATCGMKEDWFWTAQEIFNGEYLVDLSGETVGIAGINGSDWATPTMELEMGNGDTLTFYVGMNASEEQEKRFKEQQREIRENNMKVLREYAMKTEDD